MVICTQADITFCFCCLQLVKRANKWAQELDLDSQVHYLFTNVSISLAGLLRDYPGPVATLSAQFPDPLFKKRHKKRRMVQQSVVQAARELLMPGGKGYGGVRSGYDDNDCTVCDELLSSAIGCMALFCTAAIV